MVANAYLEGTYSEIYTGIEEDAEGLRKLFRQFSFPGGIPSHAAPQTPGSIHEGGELGYAIVHAYGAAFDNPDLVVACVIGDGEAETGPLAASWHSNKFLDPVTDGAVLPILHLNGYKIANPTVLARIPQAELESLLRGYGYRPITVAGDDPAAVHQQLATALDDAFDEIVAIQQGARSGDTAERPVWPMIVLRTPKGWTGPTLSTASRSRERGERTRFRCRRPGTTPPTGRSWRSGCAAMRRRNFSTARAGCARNCVRWRRVGNRRMSANPHANGGVLLHDLDLPDFRDYAVEVSQPGTKTHEATRVLGGFLRDVIARNPDRFRLMGPDETASNRLDTVYESTDKAWMAQTLPVDENLAPGGRVMEVLSEHLCQGWLEGYLLTGRHGLFNCYEAFVHIVDSMLNQHAKWLATSRDLPWRQPVASLNYLLSSHVWRQDHNGATHQDPGFIDLVANKRAEITRVYLPPDGNTLLSVVDHCLRSRDYINVIVAGKQPELAYLDMDSAIAHCTRGLGIWEWASTAKGEPDVVLACAGDIPTQEALAAADILRRELPELAVRLVNVVDLMRLLPDSEHPHGLPDNEFDAIFATDKPIIFAYHGYPWLIHRLTYSRANHHHLHVRGFKERGTTTTPFDMVMLNDLDRFHLVMDVIDRVDGLARRAALLRQRMADARVAARRYTREHGEDDPQISGWTWGGE